MNRATKEFLWGLLIAAAVTVCTALIDFDPAKVSDWKLWAVGIGAAVVRQSAGYVIGVLGAKKLQEDE